MAKFDSVYYDIIDDINDIDPLPEIDAALTDEERLEILNADQRGNIALVYMAASHFVDAQITRLLDSLQQYPEILNNSIIIMMGDNGFGLGEKRHWHKGTLWENDMRVPFVVADMRHPNSTKVYSTVGLIDLFPTLCEMVDIPYPTFADGSDYINGRSLMPFLADPNAHIEKPTLGSYKENKYLQCGCFPQYSIRNNSFHYIYYTSNNTDSVITCDGHNAWHEEELYEIGDHFQTDPNEWNNLIVDSTYRPLINYLQQWLPDSAMYMQTPLTAVIKNNALPCLLSHNDTLHLSFDLYYTLGVWIDPPVEYIYQWTNSLTGEITAGSTYDFHLADISDAVFLTHHRVMVQLQVLDTISGKIASMASKYFYLNPATEPTVSFSISNIGSTVSVNDVLINGAYDHVWWDFGNGYIFYGSQPGLVTYATLGTYIVTCYVSYGNDTICVKSYQQTFTTPIPVFFKDDIMVVMPNPAHHYIHVELKSDNPTEYFTISNIAGQTLKTFTLPGGNGTLDQIDVSDLPTGMYFLIRTT